MKLQGVKLHMSTTYHLQSDSPVKVVNKCSGTYLRCMTSEDIKKQSRILALLELWYNINYHTNFKCIPFEILYGHHRPIHLPYIRLDLPLKSFIHPAFHVSQLKPYHGYTLIHHPDFPMMKEQELVLEKILKRRLIKRGNRTEAIALVQWRDQPLIEVYALNSLFLPYGQGILKRKGM